MMNNVGKLMCWLTVISTITLSGCGGSDDNIPEDVNKAPAAQADNIEHTIGTPIIIDVLSNDSDSDGDALTIENVKVTVGNAAVSIRENKLVFEPESLGMFRFEYTITDGNGGKASAEVTVLVARAVTETAYVGSETCVVCHESKASFYETGHNFHLNKVTDGKIPEYPFSSILGALEHVDGLINPAIEKDKTVTYDDISYVVGGYNKRAFWLDKDGYMLSGTKFAVSLQHGKFLSPQQVWGLPEEMINNLPGPAEYDYCGKCHTTGFKRYTFVEGDDRNLEKELPGISGTFALAGIQCEGCHGAGREHASSPSTDNITLIADPRTKAAFMSENMAFGEPVACAECHTSLDFWPRIYPDFSSKLDQKFGGERPGNLLNALPGPLDGDGASNAADALLAYDPDTGESIGKKRNMHCSACHDPHQSTAYRGEPGHETALKECSECHSNMKFNTLAGSSLARRGHELVAECKDCHMPNQSHLFKIDITKPYDDPSHLSADGKYRKPWLRTEEVCSKCHETNFEERALQISKIHL